MCTFHVLKNSGVSAFLTLLLLTVIVYRSSDVNIHASHRQQLLGPHISQLPSSITEKCYAGDLIPGSWHATLSSGSQLPLTKKVQSVIWKHQHPGNCHNSSFLIYSAAPHLGIGAKMDHLAGALGRALDLGRVLLLDFHDRWLEGRYCEGFPTLDTCFFEPISSCDLSHVYGQNFASDPSLYRNSTALSAMRGVLSSFEVFLFEQGETFQNKVPTQLSTMAARVGLHDDFIGGVKADCYWYRACAVGYILRPNERTLAQLSKLRRETFSDQLISPRTVSIHVRHGDKHRDLVPQLPNANYSEAAADLVARSQGRLEPRYFISTEDPDTITYFANLSRSQVQYAQVDRDNHAGGSPMDVGDPSNEMLLSLLNLELALDCDAWVCTLASMWCTLIDRLRATIKCKASGMYRDVHGTIAGLGHV